VILPFFLLLTFGMSQMVINNIGGALANVAVYEAGRAAWIWKPEADAGRMGVNSAKALDRAKTAAAMVMTPVAPGDYFGNPSLDTEDAEAMRTALMLTHVPFVGGALPGGSADAVALLALIDPMAFEGNRTFTNALDMSPFIIRTVKKFTHAYHATDVAFDSTGGRTGVKLEYKHHIAMPLMGPLFGSSGIDVVGLRGGYYAKYERTFGFKTQINTPNPALPAGPFIGSGPSGGLKSALKNEFPF